MSRSRATRSPPSPTSSGTFSATRRLPRISTDRPSRADFGPDSDLDVLVVSGRSLTGDERAAIIQRLLPISGRRAVGGPARSIELTIVVGPALTPWRYPPSIELQYGDWMRAKLERGELPEWPRPDPDVAILVETARRAAVPLLGPPVAAVVPPVSRADLVRATVDSIPVLMPGIEEGAEPGMGC